MAMDISPWQEIDIAAEAKRLGFVFDEEIDYDVKSDNCNGYLIASEQLLKKLYDELENQLESDEVQEVMEGIKNGDIPNFYAIYSFIDDYIELVGTVQTESGYHQIDLPLTPSHEDVALIGALNEYSLKIDGKNIYDMMAKFQKEVEHTYDPSFETNRTLEQIEGEAEKLYAVRSTDFSVFNNGELYQLYKLCLLTPENPFGRSYDDEVFDEISNREFEGRDLIEVFKDKYTEETGFEWPERKFVMNVEDITVCDDNVTLEIPLENTPALIKLVAAEIGMSVEEVSKRNLTLLTTINIDIEGNESDKVGNLIYSSWNSIEDQKYGEIELSNYDKYMVYTITEKNCLEEFDQDLEQYRESELASYGEETTLADQIQNASTEKVEPETDGKTREPIL